MPTAEKVATVEKAQKWYEDSVGLIFTDYRGLSVPEMQELRGSLRSAGAEFRVVKNTLFRLAVGEKMQEWPEEFHSGPTAAVYILSDESACAKALVAFAKKHRALQIKGAYLDERVLSAEELVAFSSLPTRQELLGIIAGLVAAPMTDIVCVLHEVLAEPVRAIGAIAEKAESAPEEQPPAATQETEPAPEEQPPAEAKKAESAPEVQSAAATKETESAGELQPEAESAEPGQQATGAQAEEGEPETKEGGD